MAKLLGKAPNQVPTNADLGSMAFQDREGINVNTAVVANLVVTGATSVNTTFAVTNASATVLFAGANGNVGIGNNTPTFKMVVDGGATTTTSVVRSTSGYAELFLSGTSASYLSSNTSLNVWANGATRMFVAANGNVGISNTAPDATLAVTGTANISGNVVIGGTYLAFPNAPNTNFSSNATHGFTIARDSVGDAQNLKITESSTGHYFVASSRLDNQKPVIFNVTATGNTAADYGFTVRVEGNDRLKVNNTITTISSDANVTGNVVIGGTITTGAGANAITLTNGTSNYIGWTAAGVAAPTTTTRSAGTKLLLYPDLGVSSVDYAIGVEGSHLWFSAGNFAVGGFKWYSNTTNIMTSNTTGLNIQSGGLSIGGTSVIDSSRNGSFANVTIAGNLTVSGTTTYINTTTLNVGDNIITLNADLPGATAPTESAGWEVNRGSSANVSFVWDETNQGFKATGQSAASGTSLIINNLFGESNKDLLFNYNDSSQVGMIRVYGRPTTPSNGQSMSFWLNDSTSLQQRMTLAANGNFGIGNTTPAQKLVVAGTANVSGITYHGANVIFAGGTGAGIVYNATADGASILSKPMSNSTVSQRLDILGAGANNATNPFWSGIHLSPGEGPFTNSTSGNAFPRLSMYYSYTNLTNPSDLVFNFVLGNASGIPQSLKLYGSNTTGGQSGIDIAANGNVGIGTAAPANKLTVTGNTYIDGERLFLYSATSNTGPFLQLYTANTASYEAMRFLHPGGNVAFDAGYDTGAQSYYVNRFDTSGAFVDRSFMIGRANGNISIGGNVSPTEKLSVTGTMSVANATTTGVLFVAANGNIGINTTAPTAKFFISSDAGTSRSIRYDSGTQPSFRIRNNDNGIPTSFQLENWGLTGTGQGASITATLSTDGVTPYSAGQIIFTNEGDYLSGANAFAAMQFRTSSANNLGVKMHIGANGNIGIGNTTPTDKLSIAGTVGARVASNTQVIINYLENSDTGTGAVALQRFTVGANKSLTLYTSGGGYSGMYGTATAATFYYDFDNHNFRKLDGTVLATFAANGNVGIGNTSPINKLSVAGDIKASQSITIGNGGGNYQAGSLYSDGNWGMIIRSAQASPATAQMSFHDASDTRLMTIYANNNMSIGSGNTTPTNKLTVDGNIYSNNLRRYTQTRALSTTVNDTIEIGTLYSQHGAHSINVTLQTTDGGFSTAKRYEISSYFGATGSTVYRKVLPLFDTGPFSTNDYDLEAYHNTETIGLRLRRTAGSNSGTVEILIDDLLLQSEGQGQDYFTPSSTTATGVAAVTDVFPGSRVINTGVGHATPNTFIVQANLTTAAITSNNTITQFNLPVVFGGSYTTYGTAGQTTINFTTSATTANQVVTTAVGLGSATWRTVKYLVSVTSGSAYQATEITLIHDGTNVYKTEYGQVFSGAVLATFDADINSGNIRLLTTPTNAVTTYKGTVTFVSV